MVSQNVALQLIEQIEAKANEKVVKSLRTDDDSEVKWLKRLVQEHPALQGVPEEIKNHLVEVPAANLIPLGNRRRRKLWRSKGMLVHVFSGEDSGYTLGRAFHEIGGDRRLLHELHVLHQKSSSDLSIQGDAYPLLLRAALDGWVKAWIGGPPCRTRSVLRHLDVPGEDMPRPLRAWEGGEWGIEGLSNFEKSQLFQDDEPAQPGWLEKGSEVERKGTSRKGRKGRNSNPLTVPSGSRDTAGASDAGIQ